jgi:hypothetical protein
MADGDQEENVLIEVPAKEILDKIKNGASVDYNDRIIAGNIDVSKLDLKEDIINRTKYEKEALFLKDNVSIVSSTIKITNSKIKGSINMSNVILKNRVDFTGSEFYEDAVFEGSQFREDANFMEAEFSKGANFKGSQFLGNAHFMGSHFSGEAKFHGSRYIARADFEGSEFIGNAYFDYSTFGIITWFYRSHFKRYAQFSSSHFNGFSTFGSSKFYWSADFLGATFNDDLHFTGSVIEGDANFIGANFIKSTYFWGGQFNGEVLSFKYAVFNLPKSQEEACRKAKNVLEKNGDREEAGYHFYREMEAKRMQKPWYIRYPEFVLIQLVFGYGVHPEWLMYWWALIMMAFALIYALGDGISGATNVLDYIKISFAIAIAPGYIAAIINPGSAGYRLLPEYQVVAMIETIFGTFLWAGFIATFAKKYMR